MLKKLLSGVFLSVLILLFFTTQTSAQVVINEIVYNPNQGDDNYNEWVELYVTEDINLESWTICAEV